MKTDLTSPSLLTRVTLLLLSSLVVISGASLSAALPAIQVNFNDVPNAGFWVRMLLTTPALFIVIFAPVAGTLIDRIGRKRLLIAGILLYGLAGTTGYFIPVLWGLLIVRAVMGIAVAIIFTATTALIGDYFQGPARARFLGLQAGFMSISGVLFHPIGGSLADLRWNASFLVFTIAFLFLPLAIFFIHEPESKTSVPLSNGPRQQLALPVVFLGVIFGLTHIGQIIFYTVPVQLPFHLQALNIHSSRSIGLFTGFFSLMMGLAGLSYGWVKKHLSYTQIVCLSFGLDAAGFLILGLTESVPLILAGLFLGGVGLGLNNPNLVSWLVERTPEAQRGKALGSRLTFHYLGQFLSPILMQPLIAASGLPTAYLAAAGLGSSVLVISMIGSLLRYRSRQG